EPVSPGNGRGGVGIETAAQEHYRFHLVIWSSGHLVIWSIGHLVIVWSCDQFVDRMTRQLDDEMAKFTALYPARFRRPDELVQQQLHTDRQAGAERPRGAPR